MQFRVLLGDITKWKADGIVNSASTTLLDVSPLDHRLYKAAGIAFAGACWNQRGCQVGKAKLVRAYKLPATYVIQAVGPYWLGGKRDEEKDLISAYTQSLAVAQEKGLRHLAFTSLSTEDKRYPRQRAAAIAVPLLLQKGQSFDRIDIVCEDEDIQKAYVNAAVFYWLQLLQDANRADQKRVILAGAAALAVLTLTATTPDPLVVADGVQRMQKLLRDFVKNSNYTSIVAVEQTAAKIMAVYNIQGKGAGVNE